LATVELVGPNEGMRRLTDFVSKVGKVNISRVGIAFYNTQNQRQIVELKPGPDDNQLFYFPARFKVNPENEAAVEVAQAGSYRLATGHELARDQLAEFVEMQLDSEASARSLELALRDLHG